MKANIDATEDTIVQVRCIGQTLVLMGEGLHTSTDATGEAFIRLGQDLIIAAEKLDPAVQDLMTLQSLERDKAA